MKPFLGINLTKDENNVEFNGQEFISIKPSEELAAALDSAGDDLAEVIDKQLKIPFARMIQIGFGAGLFVLVSALVKALIGEDGISLTEAYNNVPWMFWIAGICLVVCLILQLICAAEKKENMEKDDSDRVASNMNSISDKIYAELGIPEDAKAVDILSLEYKIKNDKITACNGSSEVAPYTNFEHRVFADSDNIYLGDTEGVYSFARSSLKAIHTVDKTITVFGWNKDTEPSKGEYKQYKIAKHDVLYVRFKTYQILEFEHNGETWGIYFPGYELPVFEELTGLTAE